MVISLFFLLVVMPIFFKLFSIAKSLSDSLILNSSRLGKKVSPLAKEAAIIKIGTSSIILGIISLLILIPLNKEDFTCIVPTVSPCCFFLFIILMEPPIFFNIFKNPILLGFDKTLGRERLLFLLSKARTIKNAAEEGSPGTTYFFSALRNCFPRILIIL